MKKKIKIVKRLFDFIFAFIGLILLFFPLLLLIIIATYSTQSFGLYFQKRIGYLGKPFTIYKIKTMINSNHTTSHVTTTNNVRITKFGSWLRKYKLDELPQLFNVLIGDMSFVGPRPDVQGFADQLKGNDRIILTVKPGITGPASLFFKNEEEILATKENPEEYNREIIWPKKVSINKDYIKNYTFKKDLIIIYKTIFNE